MNCIIIDDEYLGLKQIEQYVDQTPYLSSIMSFNNSLAARSYLQKNPVDLIFLDINMPDLNGMELLKSLTELPMVIITSAYSKYAIESYDYQVVDYLLKPIEFSRFLKATDKALKQYNTTQKEKQLNKNTAQKEFIFVQSGTELHQINIKEIIYIKGAGNYIYIHTSKKKVMVLMPLKKIGKLLESEKFIRVHKSYIVNLSHINTIDSDRIQLTQNSIPIGKHYREYFFSLINNELVKGK